MTGGRGAADKRATRVFSIDAALPFADALAAGVLSQYADSPEHLGDVLILLPTRRGARTLREAFLRQAGGRALILPRMLPLGDVDEDELLLSPAPALGEQTGDDAVPPSIDPLERQLILTRLVLKWFAVRGDGDLPALGGPAQAAKLAAELARLLDQLQIEEVPFGRLGALVPDTLAQHWQTTLQFLDIVARQWPVILAERGAVDPAQRRNLLLAAQAERWRAHPPDHPVIAAGSTGSVPATRHLLQTIAGLPQGAVVLPGLDRALDEESWNALDQTHPQFGLRELLAALEVDRRHVADWPAPGVPIAPVERVRLLSRALRPTSTTDGWQAEKAPAAALDGLYRIDCPNAQVEALAIALAMRGVLEEPGRTAALVTADRDLARRVCAELHRWQIDVDDSAGLALPDTPPGAFLTLVAQMVANAFAPVATLAVLKHPLCGLGLAREELLNGARQLETMALRGPRPDAGIDGIRAVIRAGDADAEAKQSAERLLTRLEEATAPLVEAMAQATVLPSVLVQAHVAAAEALAATDTGTGAAQLWRLEAGEAAAGLMAELESADESLGTIDGAAWPALFAELAGQRVVRNRFGRHPRLFIWGPLEARLQRADLTILGGLNEGAWPPDVDSGPWLSRPMRQTLGLPLPERRIGLAAHDFVQACAAPQVLLTRAERAQGAPTVKARWLSRLDALLGYDAGKPATMPGYMRGARFWLDWANALDAPAAVASAEPPAPRPPVAARPRTLSVSAIETWRRDPYALYARRILRLDPLQPLEEEPGVAERGTLIHRALDIFVATYPDDLPADAEARLLALGRQTFAELLQRPVERAFWWPRFERVARWFVATERERRAEGIRTLLTETKGEYRFKAPGGEFTLTAKADRIDRRVGGAMEIIDYKTGRIPTVEEIKAGYAPQLPLEGVIALARGFQLPQGDRPVIAGLGHWRLHGGGDGGLIVEIGDSDLRIAEARDGLRAMVERYDRETTPYRPVPRPRFAGRGDYDHLARVQEWSIGGGDDE